VNQIHNLLVEMRCQSFHQQIVDLVGSWCTVYTFRNISIAMCLTVYALTDIQNILEEKILQIISLMHHISHLMN